MMALLSDAAYLHGFSFTISVHVTRENVSLCNVGLVWIDHVVWSSVVAVIKSNGVTHLYVYDTETPRAHTRTHYEIIHDV
jgi:hypothetical protein